MQKALQYLLKPLRHLTLRQAILIFIPALSTACWIALLLLIYRQFISFGFERYVQAQMRLINTYVSANTTSLKLHDFAEVSRNMAALELGSDDTITTIIDRSGEYLLDELTNAGRDFDVINTWLKSSNLKKDYRGERFARRSRTYFVFQRPIYDLDDHLYLGTLISFVDDSAFRKQEIGIKRTLLIVGIILLLIQTLLVYFVVNAIVAPIEDISRAASRQDDVLQLSKELSALDGPYTKDVALLSESLASALAKHSVDITLGRLTAQLAHDMRSPLSVIKSFANTDLSRIDDEDGASYREAAVRSANRLNEMADELLSYSKSREIERKDIDISNVIRGILDDAKISASDKSIDTVFKGPDTLIFSVDEARIIRVITNIVTNGIQAIQNKGTITISVNVDTSRALTISVTDTGIGIKPEHLPKIFDQTFTHGKKGGLGLGLAYCQNVVKAHSGRIEVSSKEGKGTEFRIIIPSY